MPFNTFPLPSSTQPNPEYIEQRLRVQEEALNSLISGLAQAVQGALQAQQASLTVLQRRAKAAVGRRIAAQDKALGALIQPLQSTLVTRTAEQQAQLNMLALTSGVMLPAPTSTTSIVPMSAPVGTPTPAYDTTTAAGAAAYDNSLQPPSGYAGPPIPPPQSTPVQVPPTSQTIEVGGISYDVNRGVTVYVNTQTGYCSFVPDALGTFSDPTAIVPPYPWSVLLHTTVGQAVQDGYLKWPDASLCRGTVAPPVATAPPVPESPAPTSAPPAPSQPFIPPPPPPPTSEEPNPYPITPQEPLHPSEPPRDPKCAFNWPMPQPFPPPGSREWCNWIEDSIKSLDEMDQQLFDAVDNILAALGGSGNPIPPIPLVTAFGGLPIIANLIIAELNAWGDGRREFLQKVRDLVKCSQAWMEAAFMRCNVAALKSVMFLRDIVSAMRHIRLGTDAGAWLTVDLSLAVEFLDQALIYIQQYVCPQNAPSIGDAIAAWNRGYISEELLRCIHLLHGYDYETARPFILAQSAQVSPQQAIEWARRHGLDGNAEGLELGVLGWKDQHQTEITRELFDRIPSEGETVSWQTRGVLEPGFVQRFGLDDGFDEFYWPDYGPHLRAQGVQRETARQNYAAARMMPGFGELTEMRNRLRPEVTPPGGHLSEEDFEAALAGTGMPPYWRRRMMAISRPLITMRFVRQAYSTGQMTDDQLLARLKSEGYSDADAKTMQQTLIYEARLTRASQAQGYTPSDLSRLSALGLVTDDFVKMRMQFFGFTPAQAQELIDRAKAQFVYQARATAYRKVITAAMTTAVDGYTCGSLSRQAFVAVMTGQAFTQQDAETWADSIDAQISLSLCKQQIAGLKRAVLQGRITVPDAVSALVANGMDTVRAEQYGRSWTVLLNSRSQAATAAQLLGWVSKGYMDAATAQQRLVNLGWSNPDLAIMLADADSRLLEREQKAHAAEAKTAQAAAKAQAKLAAEAQKQAGEMARKASKQASQGTLVKWYVDGVIDESDLREQLAARGYDPGYIDAYVRDANIKKAGGKAKKKGGAAPTGNGQPGGSGGP